MSFQPYILVHGIIKDQVYSPLSPKSIPELKSLISTDFDLIDVNMLTKLCQKTDLPMGYLLSNECQPHQIPILLEERKKLTFVCFAIL